jgi:hypothetical protein
MWIIDYLLEHLILFFNSGFSIIYLGLKLIKSIA